MIKKVNALAAIRENLDNKIERGVLTAEQVQRELDYLGDDAQSVLDIWNGTADTSLSAGNLADFMKQRVDAMVASAREEASSASREDAPLDLRWIRSQFETGSIASANRSENGRVRDLEEYQQLVVEMTAILHAVQGLRDPENRAKMTAQQVADLPAMLRKLEGDFTQARTFLDEMAEQGDDAPALDAVLREQLDKYEVGRLLDGDPGIPPDKMTVGTRAAQAYREAFNAGQPGTAEAVAYLAAVRDLLEATDTPFLHRTLGPTASKMIADQIAFNGGTIPDEMRAVLQDPAFLKFGAFSEALARLDIDDLIKSGDVDLNQATGGRYTTVEWTGGTTIDPGLVSNDLQGEASVEANMAWEEGMAQVTPNVAAALNSMFASMGGGIHRVQSDITEANTPEAERWKQEGWNRTGADVRTPDQVEGVYSKDSNIVVVADSRSIADTGTGSHVLVHELGHSLDSMLGETLTEGGWFTELDPEFKAFHTKIKGITQYGKDPEQSLMHWYFRDEGEGAVKHNGRVGHKEVFAEGYAAYAAGLKRLEELQGIGSGPISEQTAYALIGRQLTKERGQLVEWAGEQTFEQVREREIKLGQEIMAFFGNLEENRLPKMMAEPKPIAVKSDFRNLVISMETGAVPNAPLQKIATEEQKQTAQTHNSRQHGLIQMTPIQRGSPEWTEMETAVKAVSPGAVMPPPTAIYVTWNPAFAEQGASVIWKSVMPGQPKYTVEYTDEHKATQLAAKFQRQQRVNDALDKAHRKAEAEAPFDETAALVLAMIETGMRVGSSARAGSVDKKTGKKVPTFGGATMQAKHVFFPSDSLMRFKFPGKAGKENVYESRNPVLRAAVQQLLAGKKPSDQLFANTNSGRTIDYIREATGIEDIINHDTRTRYATNMARALVAKWPKSRMPKNEAALKKAQTEISKKVGTAINDTWTVARDSYISPAVWEPMEDTAGVPHSFDDSPPYGLVEGEVVTTLVPGAPGGPAVPAEGGPPAPVAAAIDPSIAKHLSSAYLEQIATEYNGTRIDTSRNALGDLAPDGAPLYTHPRGWREMESMEPEPGPVGGWIPPDSPGPETDEEPAVEPQVGTDDEPETWSLPQNPEAVAERAAWYASFVWPDPPIVAGPDTEFAEVQPDEEPEETEEVE